MLGLTISCARCHDHKFDPIPTVDYYSLAGIFRSVEMFSDLNRNASKWQEFEVSLGPQQAAIQVMAPKEGPPSDVRVHLRGNRFKLGGIAPRRLPQIIAGEDRPPFNTPGSGRLELARWIASPQNPLTARVMVNRVWQGHFGRGIVSTSDNFGVQGTPPTHPELLDWLADQFVQGGWSVKHLHRLIMMSQAYRRSSAATAAARERDPDNLFLSHMPRKRLEAEQFRDAILAVSRRLNREPVGDKLIKRLIEKSEKLDEKRGIFSASTINDRWEGFDEPCRSIYLPVVRNGQPELMALFDGADSNAVTSSRIETTVSSQTSFLLNHAFIVQQAQAFAAGLLDANAEDDQSRVRQAYHTCLGRTASDKELQAATGFIQKFTEVASNSGAQPDAARRDAYTNFCKMLFCLNEFVYLD